MTFLNLYCLRAASRFAFRHERYSRIPASLLESTAGAQ